ncbi:choice-of-anchor D domain-containing protein [Allohahella sp. A8]|uniref:choice-of-anchor D domain-containing protein n=1 Tax=Allohahella sp. A8 TaxID=3141461 RepID=UPI0026B49E2D|tara:strand:- start:87390 stop:89216 length:1827 start_codon:yes stop_codon:yes gene_type:complete
MTTTYNARLTRLGAAVAGTVLMAAHTMAYAEPVTLDLQLTCPFPLIGSQPIKARITADYPTEISASEGVPAITVDTITVVNEPSRQGLSLLGAVTVTGTAQSFTTISTTARDIESVVDLTVEPSPVPSTPGEFEVAAGGVAAPVPLAAGDVGPAQVTVDDLILSLRNLRADGTLAGMPVGEFTTDCAVDAGQNTVLASFDVVEGGGGGGADPANIAVDVEAVDFGNVQLGISETRSVTVTNDGDGILAINGVTVTGANADAFIQTNDCTTLASGESCTIDVTFTAASEGAQAAVLTIESDDPDTSVVSVDLSASGQLEPEADIEVSETDLGFGSIDLGVTSDRTLTISNVGSAALNISDVSLQTGGDFSLLSNECTTIAPESSCDIGVRFTGNAVGTSSDVLTISSDDPDEAAVTVNLSGQVNDDDTGGSTLDITLDVDGSTTLTATGNTLPLSGVIDSVVDLATGELTADLKLEPTSGTFQVIKWFRKLTATAQVEFENVGEATGTLIDGKLTTSAQAYVKVPRVTVNLFGIKLPIGGGANCRTAEPVSFTVASPEGETFLPLGGGKVTGSYDLTALENCGALTSVLSNFLEGDDNTINLTLTPVQP